MVLKGGRDVVAMVMGAVRVVMVVAMTGVLVVAMGHCG